jgi:flagellar protein FlgJ
MKKSKYIQQYLPAAQAVGKAYNLNPDIILAQAAIESGWGESTLAVEHNNFFGITAYGRHSKYWTGEKVDIRATPDGKSPGLIFRKYASHMDSFMDFGRLIRSAYPRAAILSFNPAAYASEMAYSSYISEVNGDNRAAYERMLCSITRNIGKIRKKLN